MGWGGADTLNGSNESHALYSEYLFGGSGGDILEGNAGIDYLVGGDGVDFLRGGSERDYLHGGDGSDSLEGEDGNDILYGGGGLDGLDGGAGNDVLCDTTIPQATCADSNSTVMIGGSGSDKGFMYEDVACPASGHSLTGDGSVEAARDDDFNWNHPFFPVRSGTVDPGGSPTPYAECTTITGLGGF